MASITDSSNEVSGGSGGGGFRQVVAAFLVQPGLPFASVLLAESSNRGLGCVGLPVEGDDLHSAALVPKPHREDAGLPDG